MNHVWSAPLFGRSNLFFFELLHIDLEKYLYSAMKHLEK